MNGIVDSFISRMDFTNIIDTIIFYATNEEERSMGAASFLLVITNGMRIVPTRNSTNWNIAISGELPDQLVLASMGEDLEFVIGEAHVADGVTETSVRVHLWKG